MIVFILLYLLLVITIGYYIVCIVFLIFLSYCVCYVKIYSRCYYRCNCYTCVNAIASVLDKAVLYILKLSIKPASVFIPF